MPLRVRHAKTSSVPDSADASLVQPSDWNADHPITSDGPGLVGRTAAGAGPVAEVSAADGRALLGLGTAATQPSTAFEAAGAVAAHAAAADPHPQYLTPAEGNAAYAPISHTHTASQISDSTTTGRALITAADGAAGRTALGLGTAATQNTGTSGATVPLLNGANTWGAPQVFGGAAGAEGGEIGLQAPVTSTNLTGNVAVDVQGNNFRVFGLYNGQVRGFVFNFDGGTPGGQNTLWHNGNQAGVVGGSVTGQYARWNQTAGRYEAFDLLGTANTWTGAQTFSGSVGIGSLANSSILLSVRDLTDANKARITLEATDNTGATGLQFFNQVGTFKGGVYWLTANDDIAFFHASNGATPLLSLKAGAVEVSSGVNLTYRGITQAVVQAGTTTGQLARWNNTTARYEPVTLNTLTDAADDAAAATAGVAVGGLYRTGSILKTRIA